MSVEGTGMANSEDITRFTAVDHTQEPDFFRRFLDEGNKIPDIVSSKPIILSGLRLSGGERVLDLGCGLGDDTFEIARVVGSRGRAVGVDVSETMILEARRRAASLDLAVEFEVGDAQALRFDDGAFDACRTERMSCMFRTRSARSPRWRASSVAEAVFRCSISTGRLRSSTAPSRIQPA